MGEYRLNTTAASSSTMSIGWPAIQYAPVSPVTCTTGAVQFAVPLPKPFSPLEWLDREIEKTCALARTASQ